MQMMKRTPMNLEGLWLVVRAVLIGLLLTVLLLRLFEDRMIFFPNVYAAGDWDVQGMGLNFEDVFFTTSDGVRIHGWWAAAQKDADQGAEAPFTILYFHGNAGNLTNRIENIVFLQQLPANVFAIDYRSYGKSEGPFPSEQGVYRDALAAYDYLVSEKGIPPEKIVVLGQSLGTVVAVEVASKQKVAGLILEAGFPSAARAAQLVMPVPGVQHLVRSRFDSAEKLKEIHVPVLVAHCTADPILPFSLGEELFAAANQPKTFLPYDAACHEPLYPSDPEDYAAQLQKFLGSVGEVSTD
jgi:fermentation-respiration switch protein FrsA (DUF1100 family)